MGGRLFEYHLRYGIGAAYWLNDFRSDPLNILCKYHVLGCRSEIRVSSDGVPYVLEVNANPCIAPDSGFIAAGLHAGYSLTEIIKQITDCLD